jgi:hypothetical protein
MQAYQGSRTVSCVLLYLAHTAGCLASSALGLHAVGFWLIFRIPCWYLSLLVSLCVSLCVNPVQYAQLVCVTSMLSGFSISYNKFQVPVRVHSCVHCAADSTCTLVLPQHVSVSSGTRRRTEVHHTRQLYPAVFWRIVQQLRWHPVQVRTSRSKGILRAPKLTHEGVARADGTSSSAENALTKSI